MEVLYRLLRTAEPWFGRRVYDAARRALNLTVRPMEELVFVSHCRPSQSISIQDFFALYPKQQMMRRASTFRNSVEEQF